MMQPYLSCLGILFLVPLPRGEGLDGHVPSKVGGGGASSGPDDPGGHHAFNVYWGVNVVAVSVVFV